jgi:8-oxo-dGTP pyrophosphatase MutT (NUDIX family)
MPVDQLLDGVFEARTADLSVEESRWAFAVDHAPAIDRHWEVARRANPGFFNGQVFMTRSAELRDHAVVARLFPVEFKSVLYWRSIGFPETDAIDGFGSALIRARDGAIILGRQRPGQINSGLTYLPGGFIDNRDIRPGGLIDLKSSVIRELEEETGLGPVDGAARPGWTITRAGHQLSFALTFEAHDEAEYLVKRINARLDADPASELAAVIAVRGNADIEGLAMPPYAKLLLQRLFASS